MPGYSPIASPTVVVQLGMRCDECFAMVQDMDRWNHDQWHMGLQGSLATKLAMATTESDGEMLRRLLREVMELSERMEDQ